MRSPSLVVVLLAACAGEEDPPAPLEGTVAGVFDGVPFTPTHGAAVYANGYDVALRFSTTPIGCDVERPPDGTIVAVVLAELGPSGTPLNAEIRLTLYEADGFRMFFDPYDVYEVDLDLASRDDVILAGTVLFSTATRDYTLEGAFELVDCRAE